MEILTDKISSLQGQVAGLSTQSKDATSSAGLTPAFTELTDNSLYSNNTDKHSTRLGDIIFEKGQANLDMIILGKLETQGALIVSKEATFKGETIFEKLVSFFGDIVFTGRPTFNRDTAGFALIKKGQRLVKVEFEKEYKEIPVVNINRVWEVENSTLSVIDKLDGFFMPKSEFVIAGLTPKGFTIVLEEPAVTDFKFSWTALAVKDTKTFESSPSATLEKSNTTNLSNMKTSPSIEQLLPTTIIISSPTPNPLPQITNYQLPITTTPTPSPQLPITNYQLSLTPSPHLSTITILPSDLGFVRLRDGPTTSANEIDQVLPGSIYPFRQKRNDWYLIEAEGKVGWVSGIYTKEE